VRLGSTDWLVLEEVFIQGEYAPLAHSKLTDIRQIVDLGANVGITIRLWQHLFPDARIIAVEPDIQNLAVCERNVAAGPAPARVRLVHACVGAAAGMTYLDHTAGEWGVRMSNTRTDGTASVPVMTLPQILHESGAAQQIDLLKCDIEGGEEQLFADCAGWLGRVESIVIELHGAYSPQRFLADIDRGGGGFAHEIVYSTGDIAVLVLRRMATS
jgi:FkbM family methyltransferase